MTAKTGSERVCWPTQPVRSNASGQPHRRESLAASKTTIRQLMWLSRFRSTLIANSFGLPYRGQHPAGPSRPHQNLPGDGDDPERCSFLDDSAAWARRPRVRNFSRRNPKTQTDNADSFCIVLLRSRYALNRPRSASVRPQRHPMINGRGSPTKTATENGVRGRHEA